MPEEEAEEREPLKNHLKNHLNDLKDIDEVGPGEREELVDRTRNLMYGERTGPQGRRKLRRSIENMLSEGEFNTEEAGKMRDTAIAILGFGIREAQIENMELLKTLSKTHPDLIKEKSEELSGKVPFVSDGGRVAAEKAVDFVETMKENNVFREKDIKDLVQTTALKINSGLILHKKRRGSEVEQHPGDEKGAKTLLNELVKKGHIERDHFKGGQLKKLTEGLEKEEGISPTGKTATSIGKRLLGNIEERVMGVWR